MSDAAGSYFSNVDPCYVSSLTLGVVHLAVGDRLPDDADASQIDRLMKAGAIRFQPDTVAEVAPTEVVEAKPASKRAARKPKAAEQTAEDA